MPYYMLAQSAIASISPANLAQPSPWLSDLGNGTYQNPVLFADYSDPDVVRVGSDYYLTSSSFNAAPGLPILHSRDLVNWRIINHARPIQVPVVHFSKPRHGQGVWAPAIRHHDGKFWIFYPDPDFGIYVLTADDPAQAWSAPHLLKAGKGLIDPCPFWDTDGSLWLVHGWAKSRAGINNRVTLNQLSSDARRVLDEGRVIIDADLLPDLHTLEGPKMYSRNGYYYIFAPVNGVATGEQIVFRSRCLDGPYEHRIVLAQGRTSTNGPHQGAWIDTPSGEDWFFHFQDDDAYGRIVHLQPMRWQDDWPLIGNPIQGSHIGEPVARHRKPALAFEESTAPFGPQTSDDFSSPALSLAWQWQANPERRWFSIDTGRGVLCLPSIPAPSLRNDGTPARDSLYDAPHILTQKFPAPSFTATVEIDPAGLAVGERAGLIVFGFSYAWIGVRRTADGLQLVQSANIDAFEDGSQEYLHDIITIPDAPLSLRISIERPALCRFAYATAEEPFQVIGASFKATRGRWVGAKIGLFAAAPADFSGEGHAEFSNFQIAPFCEERTAHP